MFQLLMLAFAVAAQDNGILIRHDPPQGPMPGENRTLSQDHPNRDERMFPDLAVKDLRIHENTLYVLVTNKGEGRAKGPIRITARAEANGIRSEAAPSRIASLDGGESRWVPVRNIALDGASVVSAAVRLPPPVSALDRSGQGCDCVPELDESNNGYSAAGSAIARGRPE